MDNKERKAFWDTLLEAKDTGDCEKIHATIKKPPSIFRYRSVSLNSIAALQENKLFFSSSNYYDDPFDTYLHINTTDFQNMAQSLSNGEFSPEIYKVFADLFGYAASGNIEGTPIETMISVYNSFMHGIRLDIRKTSWSICFSQSGINENLWLKYAENHKGFVLEYDLKRGDLFLCGQFEGCNNCPMTRFKHTPLYPVYYSAEKYDATYYAQCLGLSKVLQTANTKEAHTTLRNFMEANPCTWQPERVTLIKKECHQYDEEWRIILPYNGENGGLYLRWIPTSIIIGLNMPEQQKNLIATTALNAGISVIKEVFVNDNDDLDITDVTPQYISK